MSGLPQLLSDFLHSIVREVVVADVVLRQDCVLVHGFLHLLEHQIGLVELVVSDVDVFEGLGCHQASQQQDDAFVSKLVSAQVKLLEG